MKKQLPLLLIFFILPSLASRAQFVTDIRGDLLRTHAAGFRIKITSPQPTDSIVDCEILDAKLLVPKFKASSRMVRTINRTASGLKKKSPFQIWLYLYPHGTTWYLVRYSFVRKPMKNCLQDMRHEKSM